MNNELNKLNTTDLEMLVWILTQISNKPQMMISKHIKSVGDTPRLEALKITAKKALSEARNLK